LTESILSSAALRSGAHERRPAREQLHDCLPLTPDGAGSTGIASEPRVVQATDTGRVRGAQVGSRHPTWNGTYWDDRMVLALPDLGHFVT
jgi:hypothetical protein